MPDNPVSEAYVGKDDIIPVIDKIESALIDVPRTHALIALTSVILILQYPDISSEQIFEGVKDVSRYICLWLSGVDPAVDTAEPLDPKQLN